MTLFELTPLDPSSAEWKRGGRPKVIQVRAATELDARHLAAAKFGVTREVLTGIGASQCPWRSPSAVRCKILDAVSEGPARIIAPEN